MRDRILVLSFDSDFAYIVARRLRAEHVYCKLVPREVTLEQVKAEDPAGLILAGGVNSRGGMPGQFDPRILALGLPVLALGSAARTLCEVLGGARLDEMIEKRAVTVAYADSPLFAGVETGERWLEHTHNLTPPEGCAAIAWAEEHVVAFADEARSLYGLQFQLEQNDPEGMTILTNFVLGICQCTAWWTTAAFVERAKEELLDAVGEGHAILAVSGGLDSTVCAQLAKQTLGERLHCVLVETGLLRRGEQEWVIRQFEEALAIPVRTVDVRGRVLKALAGVVDAQSKQEIVESVMAQAVAEEAARLGGVRLLLRATNYSDVVRTPIEKAEATAGLAKVSGLRILEPLREVFRDEVGRLGEKLEVPPQFLQRQPFPEAGLAVRVYGEATSVRLEILRAADAIFEEEIDQAELKKKLWKYYAVLAQMPEGERSGQVVLLRAMQRADSGLNPARLPYDLLERVVERIMKEVPGITRVLYDVTVSRDSGAELL